MKATTGSQYQDLSSVVLLWKAACQVEGPTDKTVQALGRGRNFRINVAKALEAAYATAKVITEGAKIYAGQLASVDWLGLGADVIHGITAVYGALVESMLPLNYVGCVLLSGHPGGLTEGELRAEIETFLKDPKAAKLPWYLGMSKSLIQDARKAIKAKDWFAGLLKDLREDDWLMQNGGILKFKPRHITLGFKFD